MKKNFEKILFVILLIVVLSFPVFSSAVKIEDYTVLAPLPGITNGDCVGVDQSKIADPTNSNNPCKTNIQTYISGAFDLAIAIAAILSFVMLVYGGFKYTTTDSLGEKSSSRDTIENAIAGLLLAIGAYVILYTINPQILDFKLTTPGLPPYSRITYAEMLSDIKAINSASNSGRVASGSDLLSGQSLIDDNNKRFALAAMGVDVNNPPCTTERTRNCTDVNLLNSQMITAIGSLSTSACTGKNGQGSCSLQCGNIGKGGTPCAVTLTGGNEAGLHNAGTSHASGNTADFAPTSVLNKYLIGDKTPTNGMKIQANGMTFTYETAGANAANTGAHWHVTYP